MWKKIVAGATAGTLAAVGVRIATDPALKKSFVEWTKEHWQLMLMMGFLPYTMSLAASSTVSILERRGKTSAYR